MTFPPPLAVASGWLPEHRRRSQNGSCLQARDPGRLAEVPVRGGVRSGKAVPLNPAAPGLSAETWRLFASVMCLLNKEMKQSLFVVPVFSFNARVAVVSQAGLAGIEDGAKAGLLNLQEPTDTNSNLQLFFIIKMCCGLQFLPLCMALYWFAADAVCSLCYLVRKFAGCTRQMFPQEITGVIMCFRLHQSHWWIYGFRCQVRTKWISGLRFFFFFSLCDTWTYHVVCTISDWGLKAIRARKP